MPRGDKQKKKNETKERNASITQSCPVTSTDVMHCEKVSRYHKKDTTGLPHTNFKRHIDNKRIKIRKLVTAICVKKA